jgi:protein MAK11
MQVANQDQDSKPKCRVVPTPATKIHQIRYVFPETRDGQVSDLLALSTEDGRIIFYSTKAIDARQDQEPESKPSIPTCTALGQLGGKTLGLTMRIKDFESLTPAGDEDRRTPGFIVTGGSDGSISIWCLERAELGKDAPCINGSSAADSARGSEINGKDKGVNGADTSMTHQVGKLLGTHESGNRITCLKAFIMLNSSGVPQTEIDDSWEDEFDGIAGSDSQRSNSSSN